MIHFNIFLYLGIIGLVLFDLYISIQMLMMFYTQDCDLRVGVGNIQKLASSWCDLCNGVDGNPRRESTEKSEHSQNGGNMMQTWWYMM